MKTRILVILSLGIVLSSCGPVSQLMHFSPSGRLMDIYYSQDEANPEYTFFYSDTSGHTYLRKLRTEYGLEELAIKGENELDRILLVLDWTSRQWEHNGSNTPSNLDALTILDEVRQGAQFRCVEYAVLASASLNSIGITSRAIGLKTRDVEKVRSGAGHMVTETYSGDLGKWIFIDPQFNVMPVLEGKPLNAVEFQHAIMHDRERLELINASGKLDDTSAESYIEWIGKYLFYIDALFDQRLGNEPDYQDINGKTKLMLVPVGAEEPDIFQRSSKINYCFYTHSLTDFYKAPALP